MEIRHWAKTLGRLLLLGGLGTAVIVLSSCNNASQANPVSCVIRVQAQVNIPNTSGFGSSTYNQGGVGVAGTWISDIGASNCLGTTHNFAGTIDYTTGYYDAAGAKMNANWQVAWSWTNTNLSACPAYSTQQSVPDDGAVFDDVCHL